MLSRRLNRESESSADLSLNIILWGARLCKKPLAYLKTQREFQESGKHQKRCINSEQFVMTDLHMNR